MSNRIEKPSIEKSDYAQSISKGGTSGMSVDDAASNLGYVRGSQLGVVGGVAKNTSQGKLPTNVVDDNMVGGTVNTIGPVATAIGGVVNTYTITNYSSFKQYVVTTNYGVVSIVGDTISYTPLNVTGTGGFTVNGELFSIAVTGMSPNKPSITYPTNGISGLQTTFTATCSTFSVSSGTDTHLSTRWQVSTSPNFVNLVYESVDDPNSKTSWNCGPLTKDTQYYIRAAHKGAAYGYSDWSESVVFDTTIPKPNTPSITAPINGAVNTGTKITSTTNAFSVPSGSDTHVASDWQVSTSSSFTTVDSESLNDTTNKTSWISGTLNPSTMYYVRARHKGTSTGYSEWSTAVSFTTGVAVPSAPTITSPTDGAVNIGKTATVSSNAFSIINGTDTHAASHWQLSTNPAFSAILYESLDDATNKTSWMSGTLAATTQYYIRVRYKGTAYGYGAWSNVVSVTTNNQIPNTPSITSPYNGATGESPSTVVSSSAFAVTNGTDVHVASHWQLSANSSFSSLMYESIDDTVNKTSWTPGTLGITTTYYVRVKHKGSNFGYSSWSNVSSFTTKTPMPDTPYITSPSNGSSNHSAAVSLTSSSFSISGFSDSHSASHWQLSTSSSFSSMVSESMDSASNKTTWSVSNLSANTQYYVRVRHKGSTYGYGGWSGYYSFTTKSSFLPTSEVQIVSGSDSVDGSYFGNAVAISEDGSTVVIGSKTHDNNGNNDTGAVYVFTKSGSTWTQQAKLVASEVVLYEKLGYFVSISGDGNTIAAVGENRIGDKGTVRIFTRSGATWVQQAKLVYNAWGVSLSRDGNLLALGGFGLSSPCLVLARSGSTWALQMDLSSYSSNYTSISPDGSTLAIGRTLQPLVIFTRSGTTWTLQATLTPSDAYGDDKFGYPTAFSNNGNVIAIGAMGAHHSGVNAVGAVYVFSRSGGSWSQQAKLLTGVFTSGDFGESVSISSDGTLVAAGASQWDVGGTANRGVVFVFKNNGGSWATPIMVTSSQGYGNFGESVMVSGDASSMVVGGTVLAPIATPRTGKATFFI